jgi:YebC/PmpR family DNA-binding regulatory protein
MSGHSKWATIHRAKGVKDAKKGAAFTKLAQNIAIAVREGGGITDASQNFRLRLAIEKARQFNMPKENIQRAIDRGAGVGGQVLEEAMYEGFLPAGVAVMVQTLSDNKLRSQQAVRDVIEKNGGTLGSAGSVGYLFSHVGEIVADLGSKNAEEAELEVIDLGVDDVSVEEGKLYVYGSREKTMEIKDGLEKMGYTIVSADLIMKPLSFVEVEDGDKRTQIELILEKLEDLDDVVKVFTNYS